MQSIKNLIKNIYSSLLFQSGLLRLYLQVRPSKSEIAILNYHKIGGREFEKHLRFLTEFYNVVSLDECCGYLRGFSGLKPNSVAITFDDGYEQIYRELFPLLRKYQAPAAVFLTPSAIDEKELLWFDRLRLLLDSFGGTSLKLGDLNLSRPSNRHREFEWVITYLNGLSIAKRDRIISEFELQSSVGTGESGRSLLNWDQIRSMDGLVTFGAHTLTHPNLGNLGREEARREVIGSKDRLQEELGHEVKYFAYPFGKERSFTPETIEILREARFECALTTVRGFCRPDDDLFKLKRIGTNADMKASWLAVILSRLWVFCDQPTPGKRTC